MSKSIPRQLGKYKILDEIGQGGFATVYKAEDTLLGRVVALKVLDPLLLRDPTLMERFRLEARTAAGLYHPNIVAIHELGESQGTFFLAMQYVDGPPLSQRLAGDPLPLREVASIVADVAAALDCAHEQGLVHRDVKPSNILLDRKGRAHLSDFGIVKALEGTQIMTSRGGILGTPEYMSPEQAQSLELDGRSDVYSLGIVAYQMCTGQVPFQGATPTSVHYKHVHEQPPAPSSLNPRAAGPLEEVLLKAMAKQPADRYATAGELAAALAEAVTQVETGWLRHQVGEAAAWIDDGRYAQAIDRLEGLAQANPADGEIAALLTKAREQVRLAGLYDEMKQAWDQAQARAEEIAAADPRHADPDRLVARLRGHGPVSDRRPVEDRGIQPAEAAVASGEWPRWLGLGGLAVVVLGLLLRVASPPAENENNLAIYLLFVLLAALSLHKGLPRRMRQGLAASNLALALYTVSQTSPAFQNPETGPSTTEILRLTILLGIALLFWVVVTKRQSGVVGGLAILGSSIIILSYSFAWLWIRPSYVTLGLDIAFDSGYPSWLSSAVILLPALSLIGGALAWSAADEANTVKSKKWAWWGVTLAGLALVGWIAIQQLEFENEATWGVYLMLIGLALVLTGAIMRAVPILRAGDHRPAVDEGAPRG